jgi:predicted TIM-barrel fold metal-dependent hydrolase
MYVWNDEWLAKRAETAIAPDLPIVDPHHHLWDRPTMSRYLLDDLQQDTSGGHNVEATVYMECAWGYRPDGPDHLRTIGETETIAMIAEQSRVSGAEIKGIVSFADMTLGDAVDEVLEAHIDAGRGRFRGIRHATAFDPSAEIRRTHTRPSHDLMADPSFRRGVQRLGAMGLSFDAWLYHPQIQELTALARAVPECTFILDHLGGMLGTGPYAGLRREILQQWRLDIAELATCPNVNIKLGGIGMVLFGIGFEHHELPPTSLELVQAWGEPIRYALEQFGPQRCMFESNFPVDKMTCSYVTLWNAFKRISSDLTSDEIALLFHDTASRVYRL